MRSTSPRSGLGACAALLAGLLGLTAPAQAIPFTQITNNSGTDFSADFSASITDAGGGKVLMKFMNAPAGTGFIGQIYIDDDDGTLAGIALDLANSSAGVLFQLGASPGNLPAGNNASPAFVADFSAGKKGAASNGVDAGETLAVLGTLSAGVTAADLLAAAQAGRFRLALHAQSLGPNEESESFVDPPETTVVVPAPGIVGLFAMAAVAAIARRRRSGLHR